MAIVEIILQVLATLVLIIAIAIGTILFYGLLLPLIYLGTMLRTIAARHTPEEQNETGSAHAVDEDNEDDEDVSIQDPEFEGPGKQESKFVRRRVSFAESGGDGSLAGD